MERTLLLSSVGFILVVDQEGVLNQVLAPGWSGATAHLGLEQKRMQEQQPEPERPVLGGRRGLERDQYPHHSRPKNPGLCSRDTKFTFNMTSVRLLEFEISRC